MLPRANLRRSLRRRARFRFAPDMEKRFQVVYARRDRAYVRFLIAILTILFASYGLVDSVILGYQALPVLQVRYLLGLPALLLLFYCVGWLRAERFHATYFPVAITILVVSTLMMIRFIDGDARHLYISSLIAMVMGGLTITRIRFLPALVTASIYLLLSFWVLVIDSDMPFGWYYCVLKLGVVGFCLVAVWSSERALRRSFAQRQIIQHKQRELMKLNSKLQNLADVDALTGIANRRHFDQVMDQEWRRARRRGYHVALLMIDIDYFKAFNDSLGHQAGDECISKVAQGLAVMARRPGDLVARYGGEEFAVILPALTICEAKDVAQEMLMHIQQLHIKHPHSSVAPVVTVSIGVAALQPKQSNHCAELIRLADSALYQAKHAGRNQVAVAGSEATLQGC